MRLNFSICFKITVVSCRQNDMRTNLSFTIKYVVSGVAGESSTSLSSCCMTQSAQGDQPHRPSRNMAPDLCLWDVLREYSFPRPEEISRDHP